MGWYRESSYVDGRTCELLDYQSVIEHCFFEFVFINEKFKVFCRAWRKPLEPILTTDNSDYPRRSNRDGEWTIQTDRFGFVGDEWDGEIKENRSDTILMRDLNRHLSITRKQFPDTPSYFFKQEYPDWERDRDYRVKRVGYDQQIVTRNRGESIGILKQGDVIVHLNNGDRAVSLKPNQIVVTQNQGEQWFKIFSGERVVIIKSDNTQELYDPWAPPKPVVKPKKEDPIFYLSKDGITARGKKLCGTFRVLAGSEVNLSFEPYSNGGKNRRKELKEEGVIKTKKNGTAYLAEDREFKSPNTAADFVLGGNNKGGILWRNAEGTTWNEYYKDEV